MAIVILLLWAGSAVAGWHLFAQWLVVPISVIYFHVLRTRRGLRRAADRNGLSYARIAADMKGSERALLLVNFAQNAAIFGVFAAANLLLS